MERSRAPNATFIRNVTFWCKRNHVKLIAKRSADYCLNNTIVSVAASPGLEMFDMV